MRHWMVAIVATGFVSFADLDYEHQTRVVAHCAEDARIRAVVDKCYDDPFPSTCWKAQHVICLETWR